MKKISFPKLIDVKIPCINPINGNDVYQIVDPKTLGPNNNLNRYKLRVRNIVKRVLRRGVVTPNLYYDTDINFAFFPRQDNEWLNNFYKKQGERDSLDAQSRLRFFNSKTLNNSAEIIMNFAEIKAKSGVVCDYGAGTGWLARAMCERTSKPVFAIDFSIEAMAHLLDYGECYKLLTLDEFFSSSIPRYDFLGCVDTFEHLNDPVGELKRIYEKANEGASVFLSVPNFESYFSKIHLGIHPYYSFPQHLNYFTRTSFKALAETVGFKVLKQEVITFPWEAEYISRPYNKKIAPVGGWYLSDILNNGEDGERLFMLLAKR